MSSCQCFKDIEQVAKALENTEDTRRLIDWLAGNDDADGDANSPSSCQCTSRRNTSLLILNAVRDACRPFLESSAPAVTKQHASLTTASSAPVAVVTAPTKKSYTDEFPPLGLTTPGKKQSKTEPIQIIRKSKGMQKKRVRPQMIQSTLTAPSATMPRRGNLVDVESSSEPLLPSRSSTTPTKISSRQSPAVIASVTTPPPKSSQSGDPPLQKTLPPPSSPSACTTESTKDLEENQQLANLIDVYISLLKNCLVPSTFRELYLLISALNASTSPSQPPPLPASALSSILSSPTRCSYFGAQSLSKLAFVMKGIGPLLLQHLVQSSAFRLQLPQLTAEFETMLSQRSDKSILLEIAPMHQTALFSLPFDEQTDSRHNFKTTMQQAAYKNREETRDRFLYNLRAFLSVRNKEFDNKLVDAARERVKAEARTTIDLLLDSNLDWFCNFFCQFLLQIGLVPLEESDQDIQNLTSQAKLSKLHQRFSDAKHQGRSVGHKVFRVEATPKRPSSTPEEEARLCFPGHQEFFFMFIQYADSYKIGRRLLGMLVERVKEHYERLAVPSDVNLRRSIDELKLLAKFTGLLAFSPNWGTDSSSPSTDGIIQLYSVGLRLEEIIQHATKDGRIVVTVPWLVECILMAKWDETILNSSKFIRILALLQRLQRRLWRVDSETPCTKVFVATCVEQLVSDLSLDSHLRLSNDESGFDMIQCDNPACWDRTEHSELLAGSKDIEELLAFVSRINPTSFSPLKSPGASRKVRPSRISQPSSGAKSNSADDFAVASADSIQKKLVEAFFHKHHDMKPVCELLQKQILADSLRNISRDCIRPSMVEHDLGVEDQSTLVDNLRSACQAHIRTNMTDRATNIFRLLLPAKDETVVRIAVSLLVDRCAECLAPKLDAIIVNELEQAQTSSKQLFPTQSVSNDNDRSLHWRQATNAIVQITEHCAVLNDKTENIDKLTQLLSTAIDALEALSKLMKSVPSDVELRPFFESILNLDYYFSTNLVHWCFEANVNVTHRWKLFSHFMELAVAINMYSQRGLWSLTEFLNCSEQMVTTISLGLSAEEELEKIASLLCILVQARIVKVSVIENALLKLVHDHTQGDALVKTFMSMDTKQRPGGAVVDKLFAALDSQFSALKE
ncbi:hypothetical protein MPSEU_000591300 [Mayamaea pseudoterrestris]|nr:hypothetical protein MPSEU_000591300 [Mayamaea pseudoterrestris]